MGYLSVKASGGIQKKNVENIVGYVLKCNLNKQLR